MITGDLKSKIDGLWEDFWVGGITNPLTVIEQITYLMGTVAKLAMRQPFVLFKGLTFQKLCLPGAFRPG
ncbi:hypothetical protein ACRW5P_26755, partial [Escherichia coli]